MSKKERDIEIGKRIKNIRTSLELDQKQFAKKINATVSALSNWENGRNKPNMEKLSNIAKLGNITVNELLYGSFRLNVAVLLTAFEVILTTVYSFPDEVNDSIIKNVEKRYFDSEGNLIEDWINYNSMDDLNKSFNSYTHKMIDMAKNGTLNEESNVSSFIIKIENAFSEFLNNYELSNIKENDNSETSNSPKDIFNEELKDKVSELTQEYLNKLNEINNNQ